MQFVLRREIHWCERGKITTDTRIPNLMNENSFTSWVHSMFPLDNQSHSHIHTLHEWIHTELWHIFRISLPVLKLCICQRIHFMNEFSSRFSRYIQNIDWPIFRQCPCLFIVDATCIFVAFRADSHIQNVRGFHSYFFLASAENHSLWSGCHIVAIFMYDTIFIFGDHICQTIWMKTFYIHFRTNSVSWFNSLILMGIWIKKRFPLSKLRLFGVLTAYSQVFGFYSNSIKYRSIERGEASFTLLTNSSNANIVFEKTIEPPLILELPIARNCWYAIPFTS